VISYGRQSISEEDIKSVVKVLSGDYLTQGPLVTLFENKVSEYVCAKYAVAVNSATSALHLACLALNIRESDIVWTSSISFVASANCARYCGATVDFIDVDANTGNLSLENLKGKLDQAKKSNSLPKAIVVVHMAGNPLDMMSLYRLSEQYQFKIIEDASHALGSKYHDGKKIGCMEYSDFTVFSFHPVKMITTAEGGMVICKNKKDEEKVRELSSHGIIKKTNKDPWYYEQIDLGYNYRLSDLHAALGISQMDRLDNFVEARRNIANIYSESIDAKDIKLIEYNEYGECCHHLYQILSTNQIGLYNQLKSSGYNCQVHYIPIPSQPYYQYLGQNMNSYPESQYFYNHVLSIPIYPDLGRNHVDKIIGILNDESGR